MPSSIYVSHYVSWRLPSVSTRLSFRCCTLSSHEGTWRPLSAFPCGNIILWHSDWLWCQVTDSWLAEVLGWLTAAWPSTVCSKRDQIPLCCAGFTVTTKSPWTSSSDWSTLQCWTCSSSSPLQSPPPSQPSDYAASSSGVRVPRHQCQYLWLRASKKSLWQKRWWRRRFCS